jgi:hypothetical protein
METQVVYTEEQCAWAYQLWCMYAMEKVRTGCVPYDINQDTIIYNDHEGWMI